MANDLMHFDVLAKHRPVNSKKYATLLSGLIKEFGNRKTCSQKNHHFFFLYICDSIFSWHKYITCTFSNEVCRVAVSHSGQRFDLVSLLDFDKVCLNREKYPMLHNHALFTSLLFDSMCTCEQLFSRVNHRKNNISSKFSDEHRENSLTTAATSIEPDTDACFIKIRPNISLVLWLCCSLFFTF